MGGDGVCYAYMFSPMTQRLHSSIVNQVHWPQAPRHWPLSWRDELCCHSFYLNLFKKKFKGTEHSVISPFSSLNLIWFQTNPDPYIQTCFHLRARTPLCLYSMFYSLWHGQCQAGVSECCNFIWCPVPAASPSHLSFCWGHDQSCVILFVFSLC